MHKFDSFPNEPRLFGCEQVGALEALVELGCDPKVRDSVASTPMHVAAGEGHIESILKLADLVCLFLCLVLLMPVVCNKNFKKLCI